MKNLIKNEIIKMVKPTSFKVIAIILAIIVIATPLLLFFVDHLDDIFSSITDDSWYEEERQNAEERGDYINAAYWGYMADAEKFMNNLPNNKGDWKSSNYYAYIREGYMLEYGLSLIVDKDYSVETVLNNAFYDLKVLPNIHINGDGSIDIYWDGDKYDYDEAESLTILDMSKEDIAKAYADIKLANTKFREYVSNATFSMVLGDKLNNYKDLLLNSKLDYENLKASYDEDNSEEALYWLKCSELYVKRVEDQYNYFNKYYMEMESFQDWTYVSIDTVLNSIYNKLNSAIPLPKDLYENTLYYSVEEISDEEYQNYVKQAELDYKETEKSLNYIKYALDNNVAPKELVENSTKVLWENSLLGYNTIFAIVGIIIASSIVAKEYSTGSIRLLLIRPKKRWKILASKYITVVITLLIVGFANYFISMLISLIVNGAKDFAVSELLMVGTKVVKIPSFVAELIVLGRSFLTALFFASFAFMIAVLTKKSAVSIILSVILLTFTSTISIVVYLFGQFVDNNFFIYTILPYLDFTIFTFSPIQEYILTIDIFNLLSSNASMIAVGLKEWLGLIIVILHIILIDFFSYLSFTKSEIKN